jgi:hypothetical protein
MTPLKMFEFQARAAVPKSNPLFHRRGSEAARAGKSLIVQQNVNLRLANIVSFNLDQSSGVKAADNSLWNEL